MTRYPVQSRGQKPVAEEALHRIIRQAHETRQRLEQRPVGEFAEVLVPRLEWV